MRLTVLAGLYVAVVLSAQVGANKEAPHKSAALGKHGFS